MHAQQRVALTGRNHTGPPCSVGHPTAHALGVGRPLTRVRRRLETTPTDDSEQYNRRASKNTRVGVAVSVGRHVCRCGNVSGETDLLRCDGVWVSRSGVDKTKGVIDSSCPTCSSHRCSTAPRFRCCCTILVDTRSIQQNDRCSPSR